MRDEVKLEFRVALTEEFRGWVLGLGPEAVILEPPSLRKPIADIAGRIASNYSLT